MKKTSALLIAAAAFVLAVSLTVFSARTRTAERSQAAAPKQPPAELIAGPGRVEPISEDIKMGSELSGKLRSVLVEEGDHVRKGQVLAVSENDDYRTAVLAAQADVSATEATLRKVLNGARTQERAEALSSVREAQAVMNNALSEKQRREKLYAAGVISREDLERYARVRRGQGSVPGIG